MASYEEAEAQEQLRISDIERKGYETKELYLRRRLGEAMPRALGAYEVCFKHVGSMVHDGEMLPAGYEVTVEKPLPLLRFAKKYSPNLVKTMLEKGFDAIDYGADMLGTTANGAWIGEESFQRLQDIAKEIPENGRHGKKLKDFAIAAQYALSTPVNDRIYY